MLQISRIEWKIINIPEKRRQKKIGMESPQVALWESVTFEYSK